MFALIVFTCLRFAEKPVTFMAAGDIMLDRYVAMAMDEKGDAYPLSRMLSTLAKADIVMANLECPMTLQKKELRKRFVFRVPPRRVKALSISPLLILTLANNHTLDCGRGGLADTCDLLKRHGIRYFGAGATLAEAWRPLVVKVRSLRLAFIGYSDFHEAPAGPGAQTAEFDETMLRRAIRTAKTEADVVIVAPHWGAEGSYQPTARQKSEAQVMADEGADLVLGSHPHVLEPVERISRPDGKSTWVAYSMGNFVFDPPKTSDNRSALFCFTLHRNGVQEKSVPILIEHDRPEPTLSRS